MGRLRSVRYRPVAAEKAALSERLLVGRFQGLNHRIILRGFVEVVGPDGRRDVD